MRVPFLPCVPELGDGSLLALGDEDRVVPESLRAARLFGDAPGEDTAAAHLLVLGRQAHELGDVPRRTVANSLELAEELCDRRRPLGCVAGRLDAGPPIERLHLEPRVLADQPVACADDLPPEACLRAGVVRVRRAGLVRPAVRVERLDPPPRQRPLELTRLVRVARAEDRPHSTQRTSRTPSMSPTAAASAGPRSWSSSTSTATLRRSPSCAISSAITRAPRCSSTSRIGPGCRRRECRRGRRRDECEGRPGAHAARARTRSPRRGRLRARAAAARAATRVSEWR